MFSALSSGMSALLGISVMDLPKNCSIVVTPKEMLAKDIELFRKGKKGYVVSSLNKSNVQCVLRVGKGSASFPVDMVTAVFIEIAQGEEVECLSVQTFAPDLRGANLKGQELLAAILNNRGRILGAIGALAVGGGSEEKKATVRAIDPAAKGQKDEITLPTAEEIVARAGSVYLWKLYTCVLAEMVNPLSEFDLPRLARRVELTCSCFGKTGVDYSVYRAEGLYVQVARLLHFPAIEQKMVDVFIEDPQSGDYVASFWDDKSPIVTCFAGRMPGKVFLKKLGGFVGRETLAIATFDKDVSLYGMHVLPELDHVPVKRRIAAWGRLSETEEIEL